MIREVIKKNKDIIISGILLLVLSVCFTAIINFTCFYDGSISEITGYFIRTVIRIGISTVSFVLTYKYGRSFILKYGWNFIPIGILSSALYNCGGYINIFNYNIELASLTNTLAIVGFATYFYKHCTDSIIHTIIFWISGFIFLIVLEQNYLTLILFVTVGLMLISARKNKLIGKKSVWILNIALYAALIFRTVNIILTGIVKLTHLFYDSSYMAFNARCTYMKIKWFGAAAEPWLTGGDVAYYKLLWIFGLFGIVAGAVAFVALTSFTFFVCKKCLKNVLTDITPIACATVSIFLVRFVVSMLTNFGIVLDGLFAPIPILSDGTCGYIAIFVLVGLLISKSEELFNDLKKRTLFNDFFSGLISSVSDYAYEPTETVSVDLLKQADKKKYMPDVEEITKKHYMSVKRYCDMYFAELIEKSTNKHKSLERITPAINNLLDRLKRLINWDTNSYHVEKKIYEDKLEFSDGTTAQWFPVYKKIADDLTKAIFEEDKNHIAKLWECVIHNIYLHTKE